MIKSCAPLHSEHAKDTQESFKSFTSVCSLACMSQIILCLCVELLCKNNIFRKVKTVFKEVFLMCCILYVCFVVLCVEF